MCIRDRGYTIIAVPTGIVSASMIQEHRRRVALKCPHCGKDGHEDGALIDNLFQITVLLCACVAAGILAIRHRNRSLLILSLAYARCV